MRARVCELCLFVCPTHPPGVGLVRLCKSVCVVTGRLARRECDQESPFAINVFCVTTSGQLKIHNPPGGVKTITKTAN